MNQFIKNKNGQGVMEYIILSSLIGIFCLVAISQYGQAIEKRVKNMKTQILHTIPLKHR